MAKVRNIKFCELKMFQSNLQAYKWVGLLVEQNYWPGIKRG